MFCVIFVAPIDPTEKPTSFYWQPESGKMQEAEWKMSQKMSLHPSFAVGKSKDGSCQSASWTLCQIAFYGLVYVSLVCG